MSTLIRRALVALVALGLAITALVSVSPARAADQPHTLWAENDSTAKGVQTRDVPLEVGTRFSSSVPGKVTGITFWKNPQDTGTHVGSLWSADGKRLAYLVFFDETATGWQKASFDRPVDIQAGTEYVVSYHVPTGKHSYSYRYFRDRDVVSGPLTAPRSGNGKVNGVAKEGPAGTFPQGNWEDLNYWVSPIVQTSNPAPAPTAQPSTARPTTAPTETLAPRPSTPANGQFQARGGLIYDPQGREFLPVGANIGATNAFDWKGTGYGHAKEAKEWGWNTVRLNILATDIVNWSHVHNNGYDAFVADVDKIVQEYASQGIVVMIGSHDDVKAAGQEENIAKQLDRFWGDMGRRYQGNAYVWFNLHNEPGVINQEWFQANDRHATIVRATGAKNPIVVDAPGWGQDVGSQQPWFVGSKFAYEADMAPALNSKHGNVILSQHNYGAYELYTTPEKFSAYVDKVRASGLSLIIGEYGYTNDKTSTAGVWQANKDGADAFFAIHKSKKLGGLWWHATHGDNYSLTDDGSAFFTYGSGNRLSEAGKRVWALTH